MSEHPSVCSWASLPEAVYQYLVPILLPVTDTLFFLNRQKRKKILHKRMSRMQGSISGPLAYKALMLPNKQLHLGLALLLFTGLYEPRCEKTGLRGFRPGPTQTGLYSDRRWLEA